MRDWLTVIGVLLIVGILLDGLRRMRNAKRDSIRMSPNLKRRQVSDASRSDLYGSELPNGGARVVVSDFDMLADDAEYLSADTDESFLQKIQPSQTRSKSSVPEQVTLNLDDAVPMLMESVDEEADEAFSGNNQNTLNDRLEPKFGSVQTSSESDTGCESGIKLGNKVEPEEVIIINIMMKDKRPFQGDALLDALLQSGMRFGDMNIFHRHEQGNGEGEILFSLANMVKPGDFELDTMSTFQTPGVTLFMTLPLEVESLKAFDTMKDAAQSICIALGGDLKDQDRNNMTHQTMEHCRQRIQDYERKRLSRNVH